MNLAKFGLTRNYAGAVVEVDSYDLVDISKQEAELSSIDVEVIEPEELQDKIFALATTLGLFDVPQKSYDLAFSTARVQAHSKPKTRTQTAKKKYVKRRKNTKKAFIDRMKEKFDLLDLEKPIREMNRSELLAHFEDEDSLERYERSQSKKKKRRIRFGKKKRRSRERRRVDSKKFARNLIWQIYGEIEAGRTPEFARVSCNMRSIYYYVKTVIREQASLFSDPDGVYDDIYKSMQALVLSGLLSYKDFNIVDDRRAYRLLPPEYGNTNVILLAEKDSFVGRFFELGSQYGTMVQITKGLSSILMADTLLTEMFESGYDMNKQLSILSFCDFDPAGSSIPYHFAKHLRALGFSNIRNFAQYGTVVDYREDEDGTKVKRSQIRPCLDIVAPKDLTVEVRDKIKHRLSAGIRDNPSTQDWAFITGGITGTGNNKEDAISSEMLLPYLAENLEAKIHPLLDKKPETFGRQLNYSYLHRTIREYIGARVELGHWDDVP